MLLHLARMLPLKITFIYCEHTHRCMPLQARGPSTRIDSLLSPGRFRVLNSGYQTWWAISSNIQMKVKLLWSKHTCCFRCLTAQSPFLGSLRASFNDGWDIMWSSSVEFKPVPKKEKQKPHKHDSLSSQTWTMGLWRTNRRYQFIHHLVLLK